MKARDKQCSSPFPQVLSFESVVDDNKRRNQPYHPQLKNKKQYSSNVQKTISFNEYGSADYSSGRYYPCNQSNVSWGFPLQNRLQTATSPSSVLPATTSYRYASPETMHGPSSKLTIFYDGAVCVYDDVSPEKAQAIMLLAGDRQNMDVARSVSTINSPSSSLTANHVMVAPVDIASQNQSTGGGPLHARKATLARFLEKRKDRSSTALRDD